MEPIKDPGKRRWRRGVWSVVVGLAAFALLLVLVSLFATYGPDPRIVVGPRTTVVTQPIAADGLPDYEAAWLTMSGPAPPATDNAAVDLLRATWPMGVPAAELPKVCRALGIPADSSGRQLDSIEGMNTIGGKMVFEALERKWPWKAEEQPALAEWLEANGDALDSLAAAADKPRYWFPSPSLLDEQPGRLSDMLLPDVHRLRDVVRLLKGRVRLHLGEGRHHAASRGITRHGATCGRFGDGDTCSAILAADREAASYS